MRFEIWPCDSNLFSRRFGLVIQIFFLEDLTSEKKTGI